MSELEYATEPRPDDATDGPTVVEVPTDAGPARLSVPPDADADEVAALVAAVTTRLAESSSSDGPESEGANAWRFAARLGLRRRFELPRERRRGGEWAAAARRP